MIGVEHGLIVHCGMNRRDRSRFDAKGFVEDGDYRNDAIRRTRGRRYDPVRRVEGTLVDAEDNRCVDVGFRGLREEYAPSSGGEVSLGGLSVRKRPRTL